MAFGSITGFFNKYLVGFGLGQAAGPALEPYVQDLVNLAWDSNQVKPLIYALAAEGAAQRLTGSGMDAGEAGKQGIDPAKFASLVQLFETAPSHAELLELVRRNLISDSDVEHGHHKATLEDRWIGPLAALKNRVLSAETWATLRLKGWKTTGEAAAGGALQGFDGAAMENLYLSMGRPAAPQQMATAIARGAPGPSGGTMSEADFLKGIQESDIRPEWGPMLYAIRYAYPPLFQINRLVTSGAITATDAIDWATKDRYAPEVIAALGKYWGAAKTGGTKELTKAEALTEYEGGFLDAGQLTAILQQLGEAPDAIAMLIHLGDARRVATARGRAVTAIEKAYLAHNITAGQATADLAAAGVGGQAAGDILALWDLERGLSRAQLSTADITRSYRRNVIDQATAISELEARGFTAAQAQQLLGASVQPLAATIVQKLFRNQTITHAQAVAFLDEAGYDPAEITALVG